MDQFGRAVLRIRRPGLDLGAEVKEYRGLDIQLPSEHEEQSALIEQARLLFYPGGPRWLLPQGLVAISKLYRDLGGYSNREVPVRIHLNEFIDAMRPQQVARFKEKGRGEAFGKDYKPRVLFDATLGMLSRLSFESHDGSTVNGFYFISRSGGERDRDYFVEIMLNPAQYEFIGGDSPMYLVTNAEAMLSYDRASLDYTPAAQMGLELLARSNLYQQSSATLCTAEGGGFKRYTYAHHFGLVRGLHEKPAHVLERFNRVIINLQKSGVIERVATDGRENSRNPFETKLLITLNPEYREAYDLTRKISDLAQRERQLEAPFAPPPKALPRFEAPAKSKRGWPKGKTRKS
jgi:hypothetical protein